MSNPYRLIKQLAILTGVFMVAATSVRAQQSSYYIYIQSDNGQPFYTQIGDKVYSSSTVGHLIIAGLKDNVCNLEIGFPQHTSRPQQFSIPVKGKDHGYQLRKNGSADWALYNWQNQETIKAQKGAGTSDLLYGERKKDDAFAALMAAVVNDSAVLYTSIVKNDVPEEAPVTVKNNNNNKKAEKKPAQIELPMNNVGALDVSIVEKPLSDSMAVMVKTDKPVIDTPQVYKADKPLFDTTTAAPKEYKPEKPLFDTTTVAAKPYKADKPLFDTTAAIAKPYKADKPLFDTTTAVASVYKNDKPLYDTTTTKVDNEVAVTPKTENRNLAKDTAASRPVAKASKADKKLAKAPSVVKVQETKDKEGETKLVFIDSSETPAMVVTAYIAQEKASQPATPSQPGSTDPIAASTVKTASDKKTDGGKTETAALKPEAKKETATPPVVSPVSTATELPKQGELKVVAERPAERKGDTLTIILESPQMRKDTTRLQKQEAPKPLYENTQVTQPVVETPNNLGVGEAARNQVEEVKKDSIVTTAETAKDETPRAEMPKAIAEPKAAEPEKKKVVMINSDCARFATDGEVDKLRVKMIAEKDVAKRVAVANKTFKTMCLTAKQIKGLSELFETDDTKYSFLSMAYPFAADTENFKELYQLFGEESYQTRFKTLVRY